MALSDSEIRNAAPKDKLYKLFDADGLFLIVRPSGTKSWRFRYRHLGKQIDLSLGTYPVSSLKEARRKRNEARRKLEDGVDPLLDRRTTERHAYLSARNTFGVIVEEFLEKIEADDLAPRTKAKNRWIATFLVSGLGSQPLDSIKPFDVLTHLKKIERRGRFETAKRAQALAARIFRYGIITGRCEYNPAADLAQALASPKVKHYAALLEPQDVGGLLRAIESLDETSSVGLALRLAPYVFVRPGELRQAEWTEIDFEK